MSTELNVNNLTVLEEVDSDTNVLCETDGGYFAKINAINLLRNDLEIVRISKSVTLLSNAYCTPYSYHAALSIGINTNEIEGFIGIVNCELVNSAGVTQAIHINQESFDSNNGEINFSMSSTSASNQLRIWYLRIKPK